MIKILNKLIGEAGALTVVAITIYGIFYFASEAIAFLIALYEIAMAGGL